MKAIITADIVNSTKLTSQSAKSLNRKLKQILSAGRFEFYRGDSFQLYLGEPYKALGILCQVRAAAKMAGADCDVRAGIGIGRARPDPKKLSVATGEAFTLSGRAFDETDGPDRRLIMQSSDDRVNAALRITSYFIDYIYGRMTSKQAEVILVLLRDHTQQRAATKLKKSQSTINKHAQAGGWNELSKLLKEYEELMRLNP